MKKTFSIVILFVLLASGGSAYAQIDESREDAPGLTTPFSDILRNTGESFRGYNLLFHAVALASTYAIIESGADYRAHNYFARNKKAYDAASLPAVYIGYIAPLALGGVMYSIGLFGEDPESLGAGSAILQASLIALCYSSVLKAFTGRPNPDSGVYTRRTDESGEFRWGFMRGGIHCGWPSGHMAASTAVISSMVFFYDESVLIKVIGGIAWLYMALGVLSHEGNTMHWLSDVAAGSLMGFAIGSTVGRSFRSRWTNRRGVQIGGIGISPIISANRIGMVAEASF